MASFQVLRQDEQPEDEQLLAARPDEEEPDDVDVEPLVTWIGEEWRGKPPVNGFKLLKRLALSLVVLNGINLPSQIYVIGSIGSIQQETHDTRTQLTTSAVWAVATSIVVTFYLLIVSHKAQRGLKNSSRHFAWAVAMCVVMLALQVTGAIISSTAATHIAAANPGRNDCYYFKDIASDRPTNTPCGCVCDNNIVGRSCCCCSWSDICRSNTTTFFDVNGCTDVFDHVYPVTVASAVCYAVSALVVLFSVATGCNMCCCRCNRYSDACGPFSEEDDFCFALRRNEHARRARTIPTGGPVAYVATPVAATPLVAVPVVVGYPVAANPATAGRTPPNRVFPQLGTSGIGPSQPPSYAQSVVDSSV